MAIRQSLSGVLLDEAALTLEELAHACNVEPDWVVRHVHAGVLGSQAALTVQLASLRFHSVDLLRARRLLRIERDFDANEDLAALVVDMADEIRRLRAHMQVLGVKLG